MARSTRLAGREAERISFLGYGRMKQDGPIRGAQYCLALVHHRGTKIDDLARCHLHCDVLFMFIGQNKELHS